MKKHKSRLYAPVNYRFCLNAARHSGDSLPLKEIGVRGTYDRSAVLFKTSSVKPYSEAQQDKFMSIHIATCSWFSSGCSREIQSALRYLTEMQCESCSCQLYTLYKVNYLGIKYRFAEVNNTISCLQLKCQFDKQLINFKENVKSLLTSFFLS